MRLATSIVAAVLASTQIATPVADACGGGGFMRFSPAMFLVARHNGRTFVLLDKNVERPGDIAWRRETMTYDWSETAAAPAFTTAIQLTLVGANRDRRLASANHVLIKPAFETHDAMNALEIYPQTREEARVAIAGEFKTTAWSEIENQPVSLETAAWAQNPGFTPALDPSALAVAKVIGTNLELVTAYAYDDKGDHYSTTYVRTAGGRPVGGYRGSPMGMVTLDGARYLVLVEAGIVMPVAI